ncbi:perlucin-like protein [Mytilus californianus]|uniref:perlucin-like protein n=1 Tax=Mytilus californianus TaxID=6549 RepID=UPI0022470AAF|nr:perlucin-like protein [Mytilus californianus]
MAILGALFLVMYITLNNMDVGLSVNWHSFRSKKYIFMEEKLNWFDAQTVCHAMESFLAHEMSADENSFLISILNSKYVFLKNGYNRSYGLLSELLHYKDFNIFLLLGKTAWIGGADIHQEGDWRWYSPLTEMKFTYWHSNQPNNGRTSNCMCYYKFSTTVYKWADEPCTSRFSFVCEK